MTDKKKQTQKEIAARNGINERTLRRYKTLGIDIFNDAAIQEFKKLQTLPDERDAEFLGMDIAEITRREKIAKTRDKEAAAELKELELSKKRGDLVSISDVEEINIAIAGKIKAQLKRMEVELPPRLEGLNASKMSANIASMTDSILTLLHEEFKIDDGKNEEEETIT